MLDSIDLSLSIPKKAFKPIQKAMVERLFELSELVYEQKRPVIVVLEGWDAAGKGTTIRKLTEQLDARGYKVLSTQAARTHEKQKPWLWRFWMNIPRHGQIAIFDRSWYGRVLVERVEGLTPLPEWIAAYEEINQFERTLADDGTVFVKFWLHISKEEQLRRYIALSSAAETAWQVTAEDWEHHRKYDEYMAAVRDMLTSTSTAVAPWTVVPATDREYRLYVVFRTLIHQLEECLVLEPSVWPSPEELGAAVDSDRPAKKSTKRDKGDVSAAPPAAARPEKVARTAEKSAAKAAKKEAKKANKAAKRAAKAAKQAAKAARKAHAVEMVDVVNVAAQLEPDEDLTVTLDAAPVDVATTVAEVAPPPKRGRPRKPAVEVVVAAEEMVEIETAALASDTPETVKRRAGRPRKQQVIVAAAAETAPQKQKAGRPRKGAPSSGENAATAVESKPGMLPVQQISPTMADAEPPKRKPGRPPKSTVAPVVVEEPAAPEKPKRGRPRKAASNQANQVNAAQTPTPVEVENA